MSPAEAYHALLGASVALSAAILVALWRDHGLEPRLRRAVAGMAVAGALYNLLSGPLAEALGRELLPLARALAAAAVVLLWSAVRQLFQGYDRLSRVPGLVPALIGVGLLLPGAAASLQPSLRPLAAVAIVLVAGAAVAHMLWLLVAGWGDDLDAFRRRLRLLLAGGGSLYVGAVLLLYLAGGLQGRPLLAAAWLSAAQALFKLAWLALTVGQPSPLVRLYATSHLPEPTPLQPLPTPAEALAARHAAAILAAMEGERLYRRAGLAIGDLARHLSLPEHRVRAVINGHLGFRNYSAFLNHFRLREVARRLCDPGEAHLPILSIALDSGYASIGPFNRAFREAFGQTPGDFRRGGGMRGQAETSTPLADSGNGR